MIYFRQQGCAALTRTSLYILHIEVLTNALNSITTLGSFQYNFISWTVLKKLLPFCFYLLPIIVQITPLEFMLEVFHKQLLLTSCLKSATTHFPWIFASNLHKSFSQSSNIISKIRLEITHKLIPSYLIAAQIIPYSNYAWNVSPLKLCLICPTNYSP